MKIVDSFLFSQPHERNVLLAKLHAEYEVIDELIAIQCNYDFRGNYKGMYLEELLKEPEFKPFLDKITILSSEKSLYPDLPKNEVNNFLCEFASRGYCWDYVQKKYSDDDWLILSDTDEMLDFSDPIRRDILIKGFKENMASIQWKNLKYWWDFDNLNLDLTKFIPCHKIGFLKQKEHPFYHRNNDCKILNPNPVCGIEYAYCFDREGNWSKVNTFAHDKYRENTLNEAYTFNTWHRESMRNEKLNSPLHFFETIDVDESNNTKFVLDNLEKFKVNTIDPLYSENRVGYLSIHPHPALQYNMMSGYKINKKYYYYST